MDEIKPWMKIQGSTLQIPKICQAQLPDCHYLPGLQPHWHNDIKTAASFTALDNTTAIGILEF